MARAILLCATRTSTRHEHAVGLGHVLWFGAWGTVLAWWHLRMDGVPLQLEPRLSGFSLSLALEVAIGNLRSPTLAGEGWFATALWQGRCVATAVCCHSECGRVRLLAGLASVQRINGTEWACSSLAAMGTGSRWSYRSTGKVWQTPSTLQCIGESPRITLRTQWACLVSVVTHNGHASSQCCCPARTHRAGQAGREAASLL